MRVIINIFTKIFLSLLVLIGTAFFVVPATEVEAQSGFAKPLCWNKTTGEIYKTGCPSGTPWLSGSVVMTNGGFCKKFVPDSGYDVYKLESQTNGGAIEYKLNTEGTKCVNNFPSDSGPVIPLAEFIKYDPLKTYGTTTPPIIPSTTSGGTKPQTPKPPTGGTTTTTTSSSVACDGNFKKVGPLCVPKSNFGADTIAGETDAPGLATRIIKILLYFAGIVAVVMIIYGGYLVMTAAGNETQAATGRKTLTNAIIGLVIVVLAYFVIQVVINFVS